MRIGRTFRKRPFALALAGAFLFGGLLLGGCKNGNEMTQKEAADFKAGKQPMPPQARAILERSSRGPSTPGQPTRPQ